MSLSLFSLIITTIFAFFPQFGHQQLPCANSISCINDLSGKYDPHARSGIFMNKKIPVPDEEQELAQIPAISAVLGASTGSKHIYVDLAQQRLYAYEGNQLIYNFLVSTGKWGPTPTGTFWYWIKLAVTRMVGGNPAIGTYYNLPNIHYTMYFYNAEHPKSQGYSTHEAYWHNNFGHPMSHGCVNMKLADAKALYDWVDPPAIGSVTNIPDQASTPITIYGTPPAN